MQLTLNQFKKWLEEKANLHYIEGGTVVGFDYEWYISIDQSEQAPATEQGNYYKSSDTIQDYELWIDIREGDSNPVSKVYFILQNLYDKTDQIIKEFTPDYLETHLVEKTIEEFILEHMVKKVTKLVAR